jgi:isoamyl acetate esterase
MIRGKNARARVLLLTPPPVHEPARVQAIRARQGLAASAPDPLPERTLEVSGAYAAACKEVALSLGVPAVDLWTALQREADWPTLLSDGLHFAPAGSAKVGKLVLNNILETYPELEASRLPWDTPLWGEVPAKAGEEQAFFDKWFNEHGSPVV